MRRRNFIKASLATVALCSVSVKADSYRHKGNVKANSQSGTRHKAYLDGREVSADCTEADDVQGYVVLLVRKDGKVQMNEAMTDILTEKRYGRVRIECDLKPCPHCDKGRNWK
jgi:hypothetical protein